MLVADHKENAPLRKSLAAFLHDFASFAGGRGIEAACLVAVAAAFEAFGLVLLIPLISVAIGSDFPPGRIGRAARATAHFFGVERSLGRLALFLGMFAVLVIARAFLISYRDVKIAALQTGFVEGLRLRIAQTLMAAQWEQLVKLRHARITQFMSGDIQQIGAITQLFLQFVGSSAILTAQFILVLFLAPAFAASALILLGLGVGFFLPTVRRAHSLGRTMTDANLALLDSTGQFLGGLKLAFSQNLQNQFINEFRQSLHELTKQQIDYFRQQSRVRVLLSTLPPLAAGLLVLLGFGIFRVAAATLIAIVLIITRMIGPLGLIQQGLQQIVHAMPAYEKATEFEREFAPIAQQTPYGSTAVTLEGAITIRDVCFRHVTGETGEIAQGIDNVSLTLHPAEMVGITGPSGAGKTTFADLLVGLYPPQKGCILIGGIKLDEATFSSWRDQISYVSQDPFLFHDTVCRNLIWANPQSTAIDIWEALALVGATELVRRMEHGLDTVVGERGVLLSGGERQRIALARAILRKPRLLVLDEATSAVDILGERTILESLQKMQPQPIIVMIAHRAESLALCERIFRFEAGHCIEEKRTEPQSHGTTQSP